MQVEEVERLLQRKVLLVTGKGGVGKTLITVALARQAAKQGQKICIIENTVEEQIAPLFGHESVGHNVATVEENIDVIAIDAMDNFRDFVVKHLGQWRIYDHVLSHSVIQSLIKTLPGIAELTLLGRIYYMAALSQKKYDLVLFDGYASGHFLNLLTTPRAIMDSGLIGPIMNETKRVMEFMGQAQNAGIVVVTLAEALVVSETLEFIPKYLEANFCPLAALVVNRFPVGFGQRSLVQNLAQTSSSKFQALWRYLDQHWLDPQPAINEMTQLKERYKLDLDIIFSLDQGAVDEPLTKDFPRGLWAGMSDWQQLEAGVVS